MPKGPGSTSDNYVFSFTHSHSRRHSLTTYSVVDRLVGIGTLSYTELSFMTLTLLQKLRATRHIVRGRNLYLFLKLTRVD